MSEGVKLLVYLVKRVPSLLANEKVNAALGSWGRKALGVDSQDHNKQLQQEQREAMNRRPNNLR